MQTAKLRYLLLTVVLLAGAGLHLAFGEPVSAGAPRWPESDTLYTLQPWVTGPLAVEGANTGTSQATRVYRSPSGATAMLTLFAKPDPKLYGAGAEVPFLGSGFSVEPLPANLMSASQTGVNALVAQRGAERWLVLYAYGERRGLLGNGALPWTLAFVDGVLGQPNDYYKLYLASRVEQIDSPAAREVIELAHTLFPRIATWYAGSSPRGV